MKRGFHIVLVCLLALQPVLPLWAGPGGCDMAAMGEMEHAAAQGPCQHCDDCCEESDCGACPALFSSPLVPCPPLDLGQPTPSRDFLLTASDQVPSGHFSPAFRPPIAR